MLFATIFVYLFVLYLLIGLVFGVWFVNRGAAKIDEGVHGAKWNLRLLLLPASMALWPVLLNKIRKQSKKTK